MTTNPPLQGSKFFWNYISSLSNNGQAIPSNRLSGADYEQLIKWMDVDKVIKFHVEGIGYKIEILNER